MNYINDYSEYKLEIKYYLINNINDSISLEIEITEDEFLEWSRVISINNLKVPFTVKRKFYISYIDTKGEETKPTEVSETIFAEIYKWQHNDKWNLQYELRKHRDKTISFEDAEVEYVTDKRNVVENTEREATDNLSKEQIKEFIFKKLPYPQNIRFYKYIIEGKKINEIAEEEHIHRTNISRSIGQAKKKFKKFFKKTLQN